jgi:DNA polymerase-3 subunit epsilon
VPWQRLGRGPRSLEYLLIEHAGIFFDGHRAEIDCRALIHLLAQPAASGEIPLRLLLESARKRSARIWAQGAPFESKEILKQRGYRWNGGEDGRPKAWYVEVSDTAQETELAWLRAQVYGGRDGNWKVDALDARTRYAE